MEHLDYEKLDVYQAAINFITVTSEIVENLPTGKSFLANQFQRASTSIPLNIAEGAGEFSNSEKARFYRIARRSATECAAILEVCKRFGVIEDFRYVKGRELLVRIVSMLVKMARRYEKAGHGHGHGHGHET
jgi:four helix bundle protein